MGLESDIKDLQKKLDLKKAFLEVHITFRKNSTISQEIQKLVISKLRDAAQHLAKNQETEQLQVTSSLSKEDLDMIKMLAAAVKSKADKKSTKTRKIPIPTVPALRPQDNLLFANIQTLDNVDQNIRQKVEPASKVLILGTNGTLSRVRTSNGLEFSVPNEDLEFNIQEKN